MMEIKRLDLGHLFIAKEQWPVHGYVILHDELGVVLVDTGCGGPDEVLRYFEVVNRTVADALADHGLSPVDVTMVINTHLHFDHCGQNPAFAHAPLMVQRTEHERCSFSRPVPSRKESRRPRRENSSCWRSSGARACGWSGRARWAC